jgi:hypothetical protein
MLVALNLGIGEDVLIFTCIPADTSIIYRFEERWCPESVSTILKVTSRFS